MKRSVLFAVGLVVLLFPAARALAITADSSTIPNAPVGPDGMYLGNAADAANPTACPYVTALRGATASSFEELIMKIGMAQSGNSYTQVTPSNELGKYKFTEAALQDCVMPDSDPYNNNYGADLNNSSTPPDPNADPAKTSPVGGGAPPNDINELTDAENWKSGECKIKSSDMAEVSADIRSSADFLNNPCLQEALMRKELLDSVPALDHPSIKDIMCKKVSGVYTIKHNPGTSKEDPTVDDPSATPDTDAGTKLGDKIEAGTFITPSGILYAAHVLGVDGIEKAADVFMSGGQEAMAQPLYFPPNVDVFGATYAGPTHLDINGTLWGDAEEACPPPVPATAQIIVPCKIKTGVTVPASPAGTLVTDGSDNPWTSLVSAANLFAVPGVANTDCTAGGLLPPNVETCSPPAGGGAVTCVKPMPIYVPPKYGLPAVQTTDYPRDKPGDIPTLKPPAKTTKEVIHEIRKKAGTPDTDMAENPSYNEIMLAFTRERFLDPNYYTNMADNVGALKQEQTMVDSWISVQMHDIYVMQERVNALLAARASLKMNSKMRPTQAEQIPTHE